MRAQYPFVCRKTKKKRTITRRVVDNRPYTDSCICHRKFQFFRLASVSSKFGHIIICQFHWHIFIWKKGCSPAGPRHTFRGARKPEYRKKMNKNLLAGWKTIMFVWVCVSTKKNWPTFIRCFAAKHKAKTITPRTSGVCRVDIRLRNSWLFEAICKGPPVRSQELCAMLKSHQPNRFYVL